MGTTPATFNGTSTYAANLQQEITRAVAIASLPLNQLTANLSDLQSQGNELATLETHFTALQAAIRNLDLANNGGSLAATVSNNVVATATVDSAAIIAGGTYTLNVTNPGSPTTTVSDSLLTPVADPSTTSISSSSHFTLTVGSSVFTINPTANTLISLTQAINSSGAGVNATLVNIGSPTAPDYRLTLQSTALGNVTLQLNDGTRDLFSNPVAGAPATYQVNGQPSTPISSGTSFVTLAPGLTVDLLAKGLTTITVASNPSSASNAISAFVTAYNAAISELNNNRGNTGGALTGNSIVLSLEQTLRNLAGTSGGGGAVQNLAGLGVTFDQSGELSFDPAQFSGVSASNPSAVAAFLGTASGSGFLNTATNVLTGLTDPSSGLFQASESILLQHITSDNQQIADKQSQITTMQNQLTAQMSAADALIASLQSQASFFASYFTAEQNAQRSITNG
jgi:flagellar hook-associated protein 2